ncbi:unnamed protein product [Spirodela intermedia]|uniref:Uncharacterized protein n=1 Tax=Spirodela intermedia TaxID=51605 RepID=A0A7I8K8F3_SPIIN|nr:unnamed protein product [Spirodela intermedia]
MGSDPLGSRRPTCAYGFMASPSWFPLQRSSHSLFHPLRHDGTGGDGGRSRRWQNLFRRLTREGKSKPHTFHYDVVSYYKNFDDGCGWERERGLLPPCRGLLSPSFEGRLAAPR